MKQGPDNPEYKRVYGIIKDAMSNNTLSAVEQISIASTLVCEMAVKHGNKDWDMIKLNAAKACKLIIDAVENAHKVFKNHYPKP